MNDFNFTKEVSASGQSYIDRLNSDQIQGENGPGFSYGIIAVISVLVIALLFYKKFKKSR